MKLIEDIHPDKLRGGYYTDDAVVDFCLRRVRDLAGAWPSEWLEPSAGDGAFVRGLQRLIPAGRRGATEVIAIESLASEAAKCRATLRQSGLRGKVESTSFFDWAIDYAAEFDAVVGNPPYVRYQFVPEGDRLMAESLLRQTGVELRGVSNLWIPFALVSLGRLRVDGCFALVLPSELFCTSSGGQFREFLIRRFTDLTIDLFPRGTFADILQDVVVVSGRRACREACARTVAMCEHVDNSTTSWSHRIAANDSSWTRYLVTAKELRAYADALTLPAFVELGKVARFEVAIVTGANAFFTVDDATRSEFGLDDWTLPLLARTADAPGLVFTQEDHHRARTDGSRAWLLDFSAARAAPNGHGRVSEYLALGVRQGLPDRYKCRIREPWYRVPHIKRGSLLLTKRAHHYHRLLLNQASAYTTDTIYRGDLLDLYRGRETDLVATFQNTLTLLSSEIEGRSYGGGVLELVPSEVARLSVPLVASGSLLDEVDAISRAVNGQRDPTHAVMEATDSYLQKRVCGYADLLPSLDSARRRLKARRQAIPTE